MASDIQRGDLMIFRRPGNREALPVAALLGKDLMTHQLPPLDQARLLRWRGRDLVLIGLEEVGSRKAPRQELQSWWVQIVGATVLKVKCREASAPTWNAVWRSR